ncbi:hypothetical protein V202x_12580 [Gimesia aquarii]|uniref:Uncharacterized protein n=1 Tax=Gimesia aquarii TaxID=2527964 RepID=A0A517WRK4_9PLAN|nr:hypothetical protein V202x_12580 [Gimesia aquarii]
MLAVNDSLNVTHLLFADKWLKCLARSNSKAPRTRADGIYS